MLDRLIYCIITKNRLDSLIKAVHSIRTLDPGMPILVVNNASTDQSQAWLDENSGTIRSIHLETPVSATKARNLCLHTVQEKYLMFLDDDAFLSTAFVSKKIKTVFAQDSRIAALSLAIHNTHGAQERRSIVHRRKRALVSAQFVGYFCAAGVIFDREKVLSVDGFWEEIDIYGEELELSYRLLAKGYSILFYPELAVIHDRKAGRRRPHEVLRLVKHRMMIGVKHLPWPFLIVSSLAWICFGVSKSLRPSQMKELISQLFEVCCQIDKYYRARHPLSKEVVRYLKSNGGRLWH